jgi:hypothetical protein
MRRTAEQDRRIAVLIEATLLTPLLAIVVIAIVQMALLMKDHAALSSLLREANRGVSSPLAAPDVARTQQITRGCARPGCSAEDAADPPEQLGRTIAATVATTDTGLSRTMLDELWIYKPNAEGFPGATGNKRFTSCTSDCVVYRWAAERDSFEYLRGSWSASCRDGGRVVGVYLSATHSFSLGPMSKSVGISEHAVTHLDTTACGVQTG